MNRIKSYLMLLALALIWGGGGASYSAFSQTSLPVISGLSSAGPRSILVTVTDPNEEVTSVVVYTRHVIDGGERRIQGHVVLGTPIVYSEYVPVVATKQYENVNGWNWIANVTLPDNGSNILYYVVATNAAGETRSPRTYDQTFNLRCGEVDCVRARTTYKIEGERRTREDNWNQKIPVGITKDDDYKLILFIRPTENFPEDQRQEVFIETFSNTWTTPVAVYDIYQKKKIDTPFPRGEEGGIRKMLQKKQKQDSTRVVFKIDAREIGGFRFKVTYKLPNAPTGDFDYRATGRGSNDAFNIISRYYFKIVSDPGLLAQIQAATEERETQTLGVIAAVEVPITFQLEQNYPNPFNPTTSIQFSIPEPTQVTLRVYDVMGRQVEELINAPYATGTYSASFDGSQLSSGMYFTRLIAGDQVLTRMMNLVK